MKDARKSKMRSVTDTEAADRYTLDSTRETEEMLVNLGKMSAKEIADSQALRASVGAKPLRLGDARVFDSSRVPTIIEFTPEAVRKLRERGRLSGGDGCPPRCSHQNPGSVGARSAKA
jgi:hypothetical protein